MASSPRESAVEAKLVRYAKEQGIWTRKFASPARRGVPDRIFLRDGIVVFMEVKRKGEAPTPLQHHELDEIKRHKGHAVWCDCFETGREWLEYFFPSNL